MRRIRTIPKAWAAVFALALMVSLSLALAYAGSAQTADAALGASPNPSTFVAGQVIVRAKSGASKSVASLAEKKGYKVLQRVDALDLFTLGVPAGSETAIVAQLKGDASVAYAELNAVTSEDIAPLRAGRSDSVTASTSSTSFNDPYLGYEWNLGAINGLAALGVSKGAGVTVATLGSGVALDNPELASRLVPGYNFVDGNTTPTDDHGFGTFNAGLIAATANNSIGVVGVAPEVNLMPIKALRRNGDRLEITHTTVVDAVMFALDHGAKVIHIEAAWDAPSQSVADVMALARQRGAIVVAPAHRVYPAAYPGVIGVSALNQDGSHPSWTGSGSQVKLSAPGGPGMISTWPSPGSCPIPTCPYYGDGQTHFASAHVAGVAALVMSAHPDWKPDQVEAALLGSATDIGPTGWDADTGYGKVNAAAALGAAVATPVPPPPTSTPAPSATSAPATTPITAGCDNGKEDAPEGCIGNNGRLIVYTFIDVNGNHFLDVTDIPLPGVTVQLLDLNGNAIPGIPPQTSVLFSPYLAGVQFLGLDPGRYYRVRVTPPPGYLPTLTTEYIVEPASFAFCCTVTLQFPFFPGGTPTPPRTSTATATGTLPVVTPFGTPSTATVTPTGSRTPTSTATSLATSTPLPTPTPTLPFNKPGGRIQIPAINYPTPGPGEVLEPWIAIQNVGSGPTKAVMFLWGQYSGFCEPQNPGPIKVECTGLLHPGSSWQFRGGSLPVAAVGGIAYSVPADQADEACAAADAAQRNGTWGTWEDNWWNHRWGYGEPLAVSVNRRYTNTTTGLSRASAYIGISDLMEGTRDVRFGGYMFYAPVNYAGYDGCNSVMIIQNSGDECTSIEIWYKEQDNCLRSFIDDVPQLAPGESVVVRPPANLGPGWIGSAWIRASQPLGIVVDSECNNGGVKMLTSYNGVPAESYNTLTNIYNPGSLINYAPLLFREEYGWETTLHVQNLSSITNAKVKVYFYDHTGGIIRTAVDWICPRGSQDFNLQAINNLPGQYVGAVEIQSQDWWSPGDPPVSAPYVMGVVELTNRTTGQSISYDASTGGSDALAVPLALKSKTITNLGTTLTWNTEISLKNVNSNPGTTNVRLDFYDQNGYITSVCQALNEKFVDYIRLQDMGILPDGFSGSVVIIATCSDQEGGPQLSAVVVERAVPTGGASVPQDLLKAYEAFPFHAGWYHPPVDIGACPGCQMTSCPPANVAFTVCPPTQGGPSVYAGAAATVRNSNGTVVFNGTVSASGQINVSNLPSGQTYTVEVSPVNRPVPFPNGGVDQVQVGGFVNSVLVPCQVYTGNNVSVDLSEPAGVIQGYVLTACNAPNIVRGGRTIQLWMPPSAANPGGTLLAERVTSTEGYFIFSNINPCIVYELKMIAGTSTSVATGVIAGASLIQSGSNVGLGQLYYLSDLTGQICDVQPDPP